MKSFAIIGLGRFGINLARELALQGQEVLAIDTRSDFVQQVSSEVTHAVVGDARDKEVLRALDIHDFDCAVVCIGGDLTASILTSMNLMELGVPYIVCKAHDEMHRRVLEKLGVNRVVIPEREQATRLAKSLSSRNMLEYIELSDEYGIIEIPAPAVWQNKSLSELKLRTSFGVNAIAVDSDGKKVVSPDGNYVIKPKDVIMVLGDNKALKAVQKL